MDAFDRFWQWADKPLDSALTITAELHRAVMELAPEDRRDRAKVIEAAARVGGPMNNHLLGPFRARSTRRPQAIGQCRRDAAPFPPKPRYRISSYEGCDQ